MLMDEALLEKAQAADTVASDFRELLKDLPQDARKIDALLDGAAKRLMKKAFVHIMLGAMEQGMKINARHIVTGMTYFEDHLLLLAALGRVEGNAGEAMIVSIKRNVRMNHHTQVLMLLLILQWAYSKGGGIYIKGLSTLARTLAHKELDSLEEQVLLAAAEYTGDDGLNEAVAPFDDPMKRAKAKELISKNDFIFERTIASIMPTRKTLSEEPGQTIRRAVDKLGRNEPCHCGSGKKYKKCHMKQDEERLKDSSHVAGVTREELSSNPEAHLTFESIAEMAPHELLRLDPGKVDPSLHMVMFYSLMVKSEFEGIIQLFEKIGHRRDLDPFLLDSIDLAARAHRHDVVKKLISLRSDDCDPELEPSLITRIILSGEEPGPILKMIEEDARQSIDKLNLEASLGMSLLKGPCPALGLLILRGILIQAPAKLMEPILEDIQETRDLLDLPPGDPIQRAMHDFFYEGMTAGAMGTYSASSHSSTREMALKQGSQEIDRLRNELTKVKDELQSSIGTGTGGRPGGGVAAGQVEMLKQRVSKLKAALRERHRERNRYRRELEASRQQVGRFASRSDDGQPTEAQLDQVEEGLYMPEEALDAPELRLPRFPGDFLPKLEGLPANVAQSALRIVSGLSAGDRRAFKGVRRLKMNRDIWRQRIGTDFRLLYKLSPGEVEIIDLINRRDLERRIRTL